MKRLFTIVELLIFSALFMSIAPALAVQYRCEISEMFYCAEKEGCRVIPSTLWSLIDTEANTYSRCDSRGCDNYAARFIPSGAFLNAELPGSGIIVKMSKDGSSFVEVTTLATQVYTNFGSCHEQSSQ